jgi:hypothetical protein
MRLPACVVLVCLALTGPALPIAAQQAPSAEPDNTARLVVVSGELPLTAADVAGFDIVDVNDSKTAVTVIAWDQDLLLLESRGLSYDIIERDLAAFYESQLATPEELASMAAANDGASLTPAFAQGSMGGYYTYTEVESILDQLAAQYPNIITPKQSLGLSIEGRNLWAVKISDNPGIEENEPEVRFDALHHAREPEAMQTLLYFMIWVLDNYGTDPLATYLVNEREIWCVPVVNPDGYAYNQSTNPNGGGLWRKNRRNNPGSSFGVDLNRNYPYQWGFNNIGSSGSPSSELYRGTGPASEPEVAAMTAFMAAHEFGTALSMHTYSDVWLAPLGYAPIAPANDDDYDEVGALATEANGYPYGIGSILLYPANGITIDTDHGVHGTMSWTPEIGSSSDGGFWPPTSKIIPLAQENLQALQRTALAGGPYLRTTNVQFIDEGDGDGIFEPGETIAVVVTGRNSGVGSTSVATASLSTTSGDVTMVTGSSAIGPWGGFTSASNVGAELRFVIDAGIATGTSVSITAGMGELGFVDGVTTVFTVDNDWLVMGSGLAGTNGVPSLQAQGALVGLQPGSLDLSGAAASAPAYLILGLSAINAPFKGGVLVPSPDVVTPPVNTDGTGALSIPFIWPHSVPSGTQLWTQFWVQDVAGIVGFAASNGLLGTAQ